jgi:hypothetical protein
LRLTALSAGIRWRTFFLDVAEIGLRQKYFGLYAQDDIRLSKIFNVHVGVRWEPFFA